MDLNSRWRSAVFYRTAVCGLAKTTASKKSLAGKPSGVFQGQKDSDGGDITWSDDAAERTPPRFVASGMPIGIRDLN
jgi:hypothetical protein